jgi:hypothetical protein
MTRKAPDPSIETLEIRRLSASRFREPPRRRQLATVALGDVRK